MWNAFRTALGLPALNVLKPPIPKIFLRFRWIDPDGTIRDFPPNYPVRVRFGDGATAKSVNLTTKAGGTVTLDARTTDPWQTFTVEFPAGGIPYFVVEAPGAAVVSPPVLAIAGALAGVTTAGQRFFSLPQQWELSQADWSPPPVFTGSGQYALPPGRISHTISPPNDITVGSAANPVVFVLNPHWHYARYEFYDRYFGNAHLDSPPRPAIQKRISINPIPLEGFRNDPNAAAANADTHSNWTIDLGGHDLLQALPLFILQRNVALAALSPPEGAHLGLRFRTPANTFVYSRTEADRAQRVSPPPATPNADRLRYYDVPQVWKSTKFYMRRAVSNPAAPGDFFQNASAADIAGAENRNSPMVFCLDDMVLSIGNSGTGAVTGPLNSPPTRAAIFNHRFDDKLPDSTFHGLYKMFPAPPSPPTDVPASDADLRGTYLYKYPDWTRLVVAQGNLFDVFDKRTPDVAGQVVGARAAVRWVDNQAKFTGAISVWGGSPIAQIADGLPLPRRILWGPAGVGMPPRVAVPGGANALFAQQPFFQNRMPAVGAKFNAGGNGDTIGRLDIALLRCCDVFKNDEVATNFHYLKSFFDFTYSPPSSPPAKTGTAPAAQPDWVQRISLNVAKRWNGDEPGVSESRGLFRPLSPPPPVPHLRIPVVWFTQGTEFNRSHFAVNMVGPGDRDNRGSYMGDGQSSDSSGAPDPAPSFWFTAAHESGHMDGLPDEYNERWEAASYEELSFNARLPGDPYELDGAAPGSANLASMMNSNRRIRNRHFWHAAEWCHQVTGTTMQVDYTGPGGVNFPGYFLPTHGNPLRTFYQWPLDQWQSPPAGGRKLDWFLYPLGKEDFSTNPALLPHASVADPFDGILVIVIHFGCDLQGDADLDTETDKRKRFVSTMGAAFRQQMNHKWATAGSHGGRTFRKCLVHFAPQFFVRNHPFASPPRASVSGDNKEVRTTVYTGATSLETIFGLSWRVHVWDAAATVSPPNFSPPLSRLIMNVANLADLDTQFSAFVPRFLGLAGMTGVAATDAPKIQTMVRGILPTFTVSAL